MTTVVFYEEKTGLSQTLDCSQFPLTLPMRQWMARVLAAQCGARGGPKRIRTARAYHETLRHFAQVLAAFDAPPRSPEELAPVHFQAFRAAHDATPVLQRKRVQSLRRMLRDLPELSAEAIQDLMRTRLAPLPEATKVVAYTDTEWQQIMTALRRDIRTARDRIRRGATLLEQFRSGELTPDSSQELLGRWLDGFASTGTLPGSPRRGRALSVYQSVGGANGIAHRLCLTQDEACAFALYLAALTAQNFGTVAAWPAMHTRPDAGDGPTQVSLIEAAKPRRGPELEHMITAMEVLPSSVRDLLDGSDTDRRLLRSPLRVYELLLELTHVGRVLTESDAAFLGYACVSARDDGTPWTTALKPSRWSERRGFPSAPHAVPGGPPSLHVGRLRQTALEQQRRPVAHSRQTLRDHYLKRSATVQSESRTVVAQALREQVTKARTTQKVPVFTSDFLRRAATDPEGAAAEAGLEPAVLKQLIVGEQDTVLTACTDHLDGPDTEPGQPCTASFLACLDCANARALPHHLPIQLAVHERLLALRPNMDARTWAARYRSRVAQLEDLISQYKPAERERQRGLLSEERSKLIDDLLDGRLDLR